MRVEPGVNEITLTAESALERDTIARWKTYQVEWDSWHSQLDGQFLIRFREGQPGPTPVKYTVGDWVHVKRNGHLAMIISGPHVDGPHVVYMVREPSSKVAGLLDSEIEPVEEPR